MCRFKNKNLVQKQVLNKFQYILCVGSSKEAAEKVCEAKKFQYILCVGSRFGVVLRKVQTSLFQYILCVGSSYWYVGCYGYYGVSIHPMCRFKLETARKQV